jgi:hypothetical protein
MPFSQVLGTKGLQKESISKMMLLCYGAILYSSLDVFLLKTK